MRNVLLSTALALIMSCSQSLAEPSVMFGFALNFGGESKPQLGLTAKLLSSNQKNEPVGAIGTTFLFDGGWGIDAGFGYLFDNSAATLTYDLVQRSPQLAIGLATIKSVC